MPTSSESSQHVDQILVEDVRRLPAEDRVALLRGPSILLHHDGQQVPVPKRVLMAFSPALNEVLAAEQNMDEVRLPSGQISKFAFETTLQFMTTCITSGPTARLEHGYCLQNAVELYRFGRLLGWTAYLDNVAQYMEAQLPCSRTGHTLGRIEFELFQTLEEHDPIYNRMISILNSDRSTNPSRARQAYYTWVETQFPRIGESMRQHATAREEPRKRDLEQAKAEFDLETNSRRIMMRRIHHQVLILRDVDIGSTRKRKPMDLNLWSNRPNW